jgi:hypothetical protein
MYQDFLSETGVVVASIPNVGHYTVLLNILGGNFPYRERGLHDKTHLRWFTKKTIVELFTHNQYDVTIVQRNYRLVEKNINTKAAGYLNLIAKYIALILYPIRDMFVFQYLVLCTKSKGLRITTKLLMIDRLTINVNIEQTE